MILALFTKVIWNLFSILIFWCKQLRIEDVDHWELAILIYIFYTIFYIKKEKILNYSACLLMKTAYVFFWGGRGGGDWNLWYSCFVVLRESSYSRRFLPIFIWLKILTQFDLSNINLRVALSFIGNFVYLHTHLLS